MAEELEQLRQQVERLRTENERLKQGNQSSAADVSNQAGSAQQAATQGQRTLQAVYLPRERKCPRFSGKASLAALSVEDWVEEVESCIRGRHMTDWDKAMFVYDHLDGEARAEIKFRPRRVREDAEEIFKVLREMYSPAQSYVILQQSFFDRKQREGESLEEFSHALLDLMDRVQKANAHVVSNSETVLRDQFCENVNDYALRRELKRLVRDRPACTLLEVRKEAIRWVEEGLPHKNRPSRSISHTCEAQAVLTCEENTVTKSEVAELKDIIMKQQAQLDLVIKTLRSDGPSTAAFRPSRCTRFRRAPDGQPICIKCNKSGHIARYCTGSTQPTGLGTSMSEAVDGQSGN